MAMMMDSIQVMGFLCGWVVQVVVVRGFVRRPTQDAVNHEKKSEQANHRGYFDSARAEYIWVENCLCRAGPRHKDETDDDGDHACGEQDKVRAVECEISSVHTIDFVLLAVGVWGSDSLPASADIDLRGVHAQVFVDREEGAHKGEQDAADGDDAHGACPHNGVDKAGQRRVQSSRSMMPPARSPSASMADTTPIQKARAMKGLRMKLRRAPTIFIVWMVKRRE